MTEPGSNKNWKELLFTYRSYTPIPFLIVMIFFASPTKLSLLSGVVVALAGEFLRFWGVSYAGSETRTTGSVGGTQLVTSGPYAYVRNPLYVGNILMYLGIGIMSNALVPYLQFVALIYFVIQYWAIVSIEEVYLAKTFNEWPTYSSQVNRFIPGFTRFHGNADLIPNYPRAVRSERSSLIALTSMTVLLFAVYFIRGVV